MQKKIVDYLQKKQKGTKSTLREEKKHLLLKLRQWTRKLKPKNFTDKNPLQIQNNYTNSRKLFFFFFSHTEKLY